MNMKRNLPLIKCVLGVMFFLAFLAPSCKKQDFGTLPQKAYFLSNPARGSYRITASNQVFKIPVGLTTPSSDKTTAINISVSSPTGAQAGTHYTLASNTINFAAGKVVDSIEVRAVLAQYQAGRKDTLVLTIADPGGSPNLRNTYRLAISGPCFEGDVNLNAFLGDYRNTREDWDGSPYGPYRTTVTAVSQLTPTTGTITVSNIFDFGWNPITFTLDWTNPANRVITLADQHNIAPASTLGIGASGTVSVRQLPGGPLGTFSICNETINLRMQIGTNATTWYNGVYAVNLAR
jgi:hypothetical protein